MAAAYGRVLRGGDLVAAVTVTVADYFKAYTGHPEITPAIEANADKLLDAVNALLEECIANGWIPRVNPATGTLISGSQNGGFRPQACPIGAPTSSHKTGEGVDIADVGDKLDSMVDDAMLERNGLYREHPDDTPNWCHLTTRAPRSQRRTFKP